MNDTLLDDEIPEKFKNKETGSVNVNAMAKSYKELEKKLSHSPKIPKTSEDYCIDCAHNLFDEDKELNQQFHEKGFSNEQVQFIYDLAAEKMVPLAVQLAGDFQADNEIEKLINHYGGVEKWKEVSRQLLAFGQKNLPADVLDNLSSSFEGVLALYKMMQNQEPMIGNTEAAPNGSAEREIQSLMRDPKYWKEKDPSFVAMVTDKFKDFYQAE